jgi:hypothetical protein
VWREAYFVKEEISLQLWTSVEGVELKETRSNKYCTGGCLLIALRVASMSPCQSCRKHADVQFLAKCEIQSPQPEPQLNASGESFDSTTFAGLYFVRNVYGMNASKTAEIGKERQTKYQLSTQNDLWGGGWEEKEQDKNYRILLYFHLNMKRRKVFLLKYKTEDSLSNEIWPSSQNKMYVWFVIVEIWAKLYIQTVSKVMQHDPKAEIWSPPKCSFQVYNLVFSEESNTEIWTKGSGPCCLTLISMRDWL